MWEGEWLGFTGASVPNIKRMGRTWLGRKNWKIIFAWKQMSTEQDWGVELALKVTLSSNYLKVMRNWFDKDDGARLQRALTFGYSPW